MEKETFQIYEWKIENFSCWNCLVHGASINKSTSLPDYVYKIRLYPRGTWGQEQQMKVELYLKNDLPSSGANLSFIDSKEFLICTKRVHMEGWDQHQRCSISTISIGLKFEEVAAKVKNSGDQLTLRLCFLSEKSLAVAESTTLEVLNLSLKIDPKSIESMESDDTKNISIIRYSEKNSLDELLLKAIRKDETVEFILELLTKTANAVSVESQWSLQTTDKNFVRNEENTFLFRKCEPWKFSSLSISRLVGNSITMLLSLKIVSGYQFMKRLKTPQEITTVMKKTVSFFDQSSIKSNDSATFKETVDSVTELTKDLMCLYQDRKFSDFHLKCDNVTFPVHKNILSARSPVFDRLLSCDMKEAATGEVVIGDLDPSTLGHFLTYLYTGAVEEDLKSETALNLYYAADKYQVPSLKMECAKALSSKISLLNVCGMLSLAHKHEDEDLKLAAQAFVLENFNQVLTSKEWGNLVKTQPSLAAETVTSFAAKSSFGKICP